MLDSQFASIVQVPVDTDHQNLLQAAILQGDHHGQDPFDDYLVKFHQSFPMWDELAAAVWLDPSIMTRSSTVLEDVDTSFTASYGNTLSWAVGSGPGLG